MTIVSRQDDFVEIDVHLTTKHCAPRLTEFAKVQLKDAERVAYTLEVVREASVLGIFHWPVKLSCTILIDNRLSAVEHAVEIGFTMAASLADLSAKLYKIRSMRQIIKRAD